VRWKPSYIDELLEKARASGTLSLACESDRAAVLLRRALYYRSRKERDLAISVKADIITITALREPARILP